PLYTLHLREALDERKELAPWPRSPESRSRRRAGSVTRSVSTGAASTSNSSAPEWTSSSSTEATTRRRTSQTTIRSSLGRSRALMKEFPDYYDRLERLEAEAEREWEARRS